MPTNISSLQAITIRPKPHTTSEAGSDLAYNCIGKRSCQQNTFSKLTLTTNAEKQTNEPYIIRVAFAEPERKRARINRLLIVRRRSDFDREFPSRA